MLLVLKAEVVASKNLGIEDQNQILRDVVDEVWTTATPNHAMFWLTNMTVSRKWRTNYKAQGFPARTGCQPSRCWMAAYTCSEGLRNQWPDEEGDREGGNHHPARDYEDHLEEEVDGSRSVHITLS
jgi:hypothetical protein